MLIEYKHWNSLVQVKSVKFGSYIHMLIYEWRPEKMIILSWWWMAKDKNNKHINIQYLISILQRSSSSLLLQYSSFCICFLIFSSWIFLARMLGFTSTCRSGFTFFYKKNTAKLYVRECILQCHWPLFSHCGPNYWSRIRMFQKNYTWRGWTLWHTK